MKHILKFSCCTTLLVLTGHPGAAESVNYYQTTDRYGHPVYSDKPIDDPAQGESQPKPLSQIQTTQIKTPNVKFVTAKPERKNRGRSGKNNLAKKGKGQASSSVCNQTKQAIKQLENDLRRKSDAVEFDNLKSKLKRLRWKRMKRC